MSFPTNIIVNGFASLSFNGCCILGYIQFELCLFARDWLEKVNLINQVFK